MQALAGVELPDGWAWADSTTSVGNASSAPAAHKIVPSGAAMVASDNNNEQVVLVNGTLTVRRPSSKSGASKSGLREEAAKADGADSPGYTEDSAKKCAEALADAQKVLSDPKVTKAQVDAALQALKGAEAGLVEKGDKSELQDELSKADGNDPSAYTDESAKA